jgi:hypothetical protein
MCNYFSAFDQGQGVDRSADEIKRIVVLGTSLKL